MMMLASALMYTFQQTLMSRLQQVLDHAPPPAPLYIATPTPSVNPTPVTTFFVMQHIARLQLPKPAASPLRLPTPKSTTLFDLIDRLLVTAKPTYAPTSRPSVSNRGSEDVCESFGLDRESCSRNSCCDFVDNKCWSAQFAQACTPSDTSDSEKDNKEVVRLSADAQAQQEAAQSEQKEATQVAADAQAQEMEAQQADKEAAQIADNARWLP